MPRALNALDLPVQAATPATPPAGVATLFTRTRGGRALLGSVGPSGVDTTYQPNLWGNRVTAATPNVNATTWSMIGTPTPVATGTATARTIANTGLLASLRRMGFVSAATAQAAAGARLGAGNHWRGNAPLCGGWFFVTRFALVTTATTNRVFVGLASTTLTLATDPSTVTNMCGLGSDSGDANMQAMTNDASGVATKTDLGASFPARTGGVIYEAVMFAAPNSATVEWRLERLETGASTSGSFDPANLPVNTALLQAQAIHGNGATAAAVAMDIISMYVETDY